MRTRHKNWISNVNIGVNVPNDISDLPLTTETAQVYHLSGANATYDKALYKNQAAYNKVVRIISSQTWSVPDNVNEIFVVAVGGGGGGGYGNTAATDYSSSGGGSGFVASAILRVHPGDKYPCVVGAGGQGGQGGSSDLRATAGGTTSFGNVLLQQAETPEPQRLMLLRVQAKAVIQAALAVPRGGIIAQPLLAMVELMETMGSGVQAIQVIWVEGMVYKLFYPITKQQTLHTIV